MNECLGCHDFNTGHGTEEIIPDQTGDLTT